MKSNNRKLPWQLSNQQILTHSPTPQNRTLITNRTLSPFKILSVNNELKAEATADPGSQMHPSNRLEPRLIPIEVVKLTLLSTVGLQQKMDVKTLTFGPFLH